MLAFGFAEILMLALVSGGGNSTDLVALVQPTHYFQSRQIEVSIDKMVELVGREPKDPKTQIQQLVALRHLAADTDNLKKAANYAAHRQALEQIGQGKKAQDSLGFAQEYANRVLAKLDGAKGDTVKTKPLRAEALSWFPANATFAFALDMQQPRGPDGHDPLKDILKLMPDREKKEMYTFIEKAGNVRIERVAFAMVSGNGKRDEQKMFLRFTGKGNHAWATEMVKTMSRGGAPETKQWKDDKGTPITMINDKGNTPAILVIGDTDFVVTGFDMPQGKDRDLVDELMDARAKKKPNAGTGALKDTLAKVPEKAVAMLIGEIPSDLKREFRAGIGAVPEKLVGFVERTQNGMDVQLQAAMVNADDAKIFVQKVGDLRKEGMAALQQAMKQPLPPDFPPLPFQSLINMLESLQVQSQDDKVQVRVVVPDGLIQQMGSMGMMLFGARDFAPPPKEEKK